MRILLLGKSGQVGRELQRSLAPLGELLALDRNQADLSDPESLQAAIKNFKPNWIVNAAAYTAVDKAEEENDLAYTVNADSLGVLAEEAIKLNAWLIHYSTDYVYDGYKQGKYVEADDVNPLSVYGKTKLAGENRIRQVGCKHLIFRTSWVFAAKGKNFVKSILNLAAEREELRVVADQFGSPTSAELIADVTSQCMEQLINNGQSATQDIIGTYHLVASGEVSWHEYAKYIIRKAKSLGFKLKVSTEKIFPVATEKYPTPARRPLYSVLNTKKLIDAFNINLPHWSYHVDRMLIEIVENNRKWLIEKE